MGHIKKVLAMKELPRRKITPNMMWTDLCENVHLHYRNVRFDFSEVEFARFRAAMNHLGMAVEYCSNDYGYSEGDPNFLVQQKFEEPLNADSDYYTNRAVIEAQRDGTYHFHYRDLRLHFDEAEFEEIALAFSTALHVSTRTLPDEIFPYADVTEKTRETISLKFIQPYDEGHRPGVFDKEHREGIEYCKRLIVEGKTIRPILVDTRGQRLDGFKRYFAHKELKIDSIECYVDPFGKMGGQHNQSMVDDSRVPPDFSEKLIAAGKRLNSDVGDARLEGCEELKLIECLECGFENSVPTDSDYGDAFTCKKCGQMNGNNPVLYKNQCAKCGLFFETRTASASTSRWECEKCKTWNDNELREAI